jgi:hypothetical protein
MAKNKQNSSKRSGAATTRVKTQDARKPAHDVQSVSNVITPKLLGLSNTNNLNPPVQPSKFTITISVDFGATS